MHIVYNFLGGVSGVSGYGDMGYNGAMEFVYILFGAMLPCILRWLSYLFSKKKSYTYRVYADGRKELLSIEKKPKPKCFQ
jgi:hypothetical protein